MDIFKTSLKLLAITVIAAALLGAVNSITKPVIAENDKAARELAMAEVLPGLSGVSFSDEIETGNASGVTSYFIASNAGDDCYVMFVTTQGDQGLMTCAVGIDGEGMILGVKLVSHNETPGLGANAANPEFLVQYADKKGPFTVVKAQAVSSNEIEAVSSATNTSKGVTEAVNAALEFLRVNGLSAKDKSN
ncbi:MAG: FMN-binding protein [Clostridiales bacterium]|jgi:electron transport complex protein RnfG|nr:FMN-binding protein [Clostridiales bacterium]